MLPSHWERSEGPLDLCKGKLWQPAFSFSKLWGWKRDGRWQPKQTKGYIRCQSWQGEWAEKRRRDWRCRDLGGEKQTELPGWGRTDKYPVRWGETAAKKCSFVFTLLQRNAENPFFAARSKVLWSQWDFSRSWIRPFKRRAAIIQ